MLKIYFIILMCGIIFLPSFGNNMPNITLKIKVISNEGMPIDQIDMNIDESKLNSSKNELLHNIKNFNFDRELSLPLDLNDYGWSIKCQAPGYHPLRMPPVSIYIYKINEQLKFHDYKQESFDLPVTIVLKRIIGRLLPSGTHEIVFDRKKQARIKFDLCTLAKNISPNAAFWEIISPEDEGKQEGFSSQEIIPMMKNYVLNFSGTLDGGFIPVPRAISLYDLKKAPKDGYKSQIDIIWDGSITPLFAFVKIGDQYGKICVDNTSTTRSGMVKINITFVWAQELGDQDLSSDNNPEDFVLPVLIDLGNIRSK